MKLNILTDILILTSQHSTMKTFFALCKSQVCCEMKSEGENNLSTLNEEKRERTQLFLKDEVFLFCACMYLWTSIHSIFYT